MNYVARKAYESKKTFVIGSFFPCSNVNSYGDTPSLGYQLKMCVLYKVKSCSIRGTWLVISNILYNNYLSLIVVLLHVCAGLFITKSNAVIG